MLGQTYYWSESKSTPEYAVACDVNYYCNVARDEQKRTGDAISVRCLRNENGATTSWQSCPGTPTVTDHEGNVYNTVQIGNQCWTRENLRTTTSPSTGAKLVNPENFTDNQATRSYTSKAAFWYMNDSAMYAPKNYGLHYNWCAAVDTFRPGYPEVATYSNINSYNYWNCTFSTNHRRGICPEGWHIPSDDEWTQLINYVKSQSTCNYLCNNDISNFAKALSSTEGWEISLETCAVGNNPSDNNATGFSLVPAGFCSGNFSFAGQTSYLWSSTQRDSGSAWSRNLDYNLAAMHRNAVFKYYPRSVRCLRD